jgi:hypothetical protein
MYDDSSVASLLAWAYVRGYAAGSYQRDFAVPSCDAYAPHALDDWGPIGSEAWRALARALQGVAP